MADYSALDRLLHRMALASPAVAEMIHDIERGLFLSGSPQVDGRHVFVTGLARAGTTVLMREIHRSGAFGSLTYADMPFVLAPNLWACLARRQSAGARRERAHGDGIEVDFHSPEALDEVYWRIFDGPRYLRPEGLIPHSPGVETLAGYGDLIRLVLRRTGCDRYLAKNNNTLLRVGALAKDMPRAVFLVALRDPVQHAMSLRNQHRRFSGADTFTRDYMTWLGHHEFGATLRPLLPDGGDRGDPEGLDYWLQVWIAAHAAFEAAAQAHDGVVFVPSELLSRDAAVWRALAERLEIPLAEPGELRPVPSRPPEAHDALLAERALRIHRRLMDRAAAQLRLG